MMNLLRRNNGERLFKHKVEALVDRIEPFFSSDHMILDFGSGTCMVTDILQHKQYQVTPVDVTNRSYYSFIKPYIYDGKTLPFGDNSFDTALIIAVLHHTVDPEALLKEVARTAKKIVILEDLYTNTLQKYYTFFIDSVMNKQFFHHPRTNKTDAQWKEIFQRNGLRLRKAEYETNYGYLLNAFYYLEKH